MSLRDFRFLHCKLQAFNSLCSSALHSLPRTGSVIDSVMAGTQSRLCLVLDGLEAGSPVVGLSLMPPGINVTLLVIIALFSNIKRSEMKCQGR